MSRRKHLILFCLVLQLCLCGCRTAFAPTDAPGAFGTCQPGHFWAPDDTGEYKTAPGAYEAGLAEKYLHRRYRAEIYNEYHMDHFRLDFSWKRLELEEGVWDFTGPDWVMEGAVREDKEILVVLGMDAPLHYKEKKRRYIGPEHLEYYLEYVRRVVERYGDDISGVEIWNEPNFPRFWKGPDEDFFTLTRETVRTIKEINPDLPVAVGALMYHPVSGGKKFLKKMIDAGALEGADALSLHPYAMSMEAAAKRTAEAGELLRSAGYDHEVWITEMGFPTTGWYTTKSSEANHYRQTVKGLTLLSAAGVSRMYWYKAFDSYDPDHAPLIVNSERSFGLISRSYESKPGALAFGALVPLLNGSRYDPELAALKGPQKSAVRLYPFQTTEGNTVCIIWSVTAKKELELQISDLQDALVTSISGKRDELWRAPLSETILLKDQPLILTGRGTPLITVR